VRRIGKHIVADLEEPNGDPRGQWIIHLGMTGSTLVADPLSEIPKHTHLIARISSGKEIRFVDPRMFGKLAVAPKAKLFEAAGMEPLKVSVEEFQRLFRGRNTPIKSALLNQKLLSGVGNIYADESLFRAVIRPRRKAKSLTRADLARLHEKVGEVLREAVELGGSSVNDYVDSEGNEGFFQLRHNVYQRTDKPCLVCKTPIKRVVIGGRSSHYCPKCQK
jgi:formamidopyrimidine-DNA glycosylase